MNGEAVRLLVADDHALFREGLKALLSATPGIEMVGEAEPLRVKIPSLWQRRSSPISS